MRLNIAERKVAPDITVVEVSGRLALGRESVCATVDAATAAV
jgi:hypothetical protein